MGSRLSRQSSLEEESAEEPCAGRLEGGRGDFNLSSLLLHPQKLPGVLRKASPAPYVRRVGWLREIQATIREHKREHAVHILRLLRKVKAAGERTGWERRAGQATKGCARRRRGRGLRAPQPAGCGSEPAFPGPLLGGAGLQTPWRGRLFVRVPSTAGGSRHPPGVPAASSCPRPGEGHLSRLPGDRERGREGAGQRAVLHPGKGVSKPQSAPSTSLHASPCVCLSSMPPREKSPLSHCHHIPLCPPSQAGQGLSLVVPRMVLERTSETLQSESRGKGVSVSVGACFCLLPFRNRKASVQTVWCQTDAEDRALLLERSHRSIAQCYHHFPGNSAIGSTGDKSSLWLRHKPPTILSLHFFIK